MHIHLSERIRWDGKLQQPDPQLRNYTLEMTNNVALAPSRSDPTKFKVILMDDPGGDSNAGGKSHTLSIDANASLSDKDDHPYQGSNIPFAFGLAYGGRGKPQMTPK
jgi:hypothetical protein